MCEGGDRSSKNRFGSCSSRIIAHTDTFDLDVDIVDINEVDLSSSNDAAATSYTDDDCGLFSIVKDYASEEEKDIAEEENNLLAVRTKRTESHNDDSVDNFLLTPEEVVRFVQDHISNAVDL